MTYWTGVLNNFLTMIGLYCEIFCYLFIALVAVLSAIKSVFYIFGIDNKIKQRKAEKRENKDLIKSIESEMTFKTFTSTNVSHYEEQVIAVNDVDKILKRCLK